MFHKRFLSSVISAAVVFGIILFSHEIIFGIGVSLITLIGLIEFYKLCEKNGIYVFKKFSVLAGIMFPVLFTFKISDNLGLLSILLLLLMLLCLFLLEFTKKNSENTIADISFSFFGIMYIGLPMSFLVPLRYMESGPVYALMVIAIVKSADIAAYLIGSKFGKKGLIPRISPKKSIRGSVAGLIASVLTSFIFIFFTEISFLHLLIIGLILGILAQVGDLSESLVKRYFQAKDSGNIIPGFGGVLDLLDSLLFAVPAFYFYIFYLT